VTLNHQSRNAVIIRHAFERAGVDARIAEGDTEGADAVVAIWLKP
jgi:hypothetical protein